VSGALLYDVREHAEREPHEVLFDCRQARTARRFHLLRRWKVSEERRPVRDLLALRARLVQETESGPRR
jgi:hypothetical protein